MISVLITVLLHSVNLPGSQTARLRDVGDSVMDHRQSLPPAQFLDREQVHALQGEARGERVPEVVEAEIMDSCGSDCLGEGFLSPMCVRGAACTCSCS
jgi:hypothetical protein